MRRLTIIVASDDPKRLTAALEIAAAAAALDQPVRMFFQREGVRAFVGSPDPLLAEAMALGVTMIACQTGLADTALDASALSEGVQVGGLVSLLADAGDDRLLMA
jgi:predicted peroxiredoxin